MSFVGYMFKLFAYDMGPVGSALLVLLAVGSMWLGYRFSKPSDSQLQSGVLQGRVTKALSVNKSFYWRWRGGTVRHAHGHSVRLGGRNAGAR
jgi:hypothetical protein